MLGKILNINPTSDYRGKSKSYNKKSDFKRILHGYTNPHHDSSDISAASNFLQKTKWQILKLNQLPDSVSLEFIVEDLKVKTDIDLRDFSSLKKLKYSICQVLEDADLSSQISIIISSYVTEIPKVQYIPYFQFDSVRILFNRIEKLDVKSSISKYDSALVDSLLEGQVQNLENEFNYLNSAVLTFVKLITALGIILAPSQEQYGSTICIEKILPISTKD